MWAKFWRFLVRLSITLNVITRHIKMPQNTRFGSGRRETLCLHWAILHEDYNIRWAGYAVWLLDLPDPGHCKNVLVDYRKQGLRKLWTRK